MSWPAVPGAYTNHTIPVNRFQGIADQVEKYLVNMLMRTIGIVEVILKIGLNFNPGIMRHPLAMFYRKKVV